MVLEADPGRSRLSAQFEHSSSSSFLLSPSSFPFEMIRADLFLLLLSLHVDQDLKGDNILVDPHNNGVCKITDFGISKQSCSFFPPPRSPPRTSLH